MRRTSKILIAVGVLLVILAGVWRLVAPDILVKYPDNLDKTAQATGTLTLYVDPATAAPQPKAQVLPLGIKRRLHVVESSSSTVVIQEDDIEKIGPLPEQNFKQRYVLNRRTMKDKADPRTYAYVEGNTVDRSPNYAVNLPFDTGSGPYQIWKNEIGAPYTFRQDGATVHRDGLTLCPMLGKVRKAPVKDYYIDQLKSQGIPKQLTLAQLTPQLKAQGIDPTLLASQVLPQLSSADRASVLSTLAQPIALKYVLDVDTRLLVEPRTGGFVSLDRINQTIYAQPDIAGIGRVQAILAKPAYASKPAVSAAATTLDKLVTSPPTTRIFTIDYGQTPASVADLASYVKDLGDKIDLAETTIPLVLLVAGGVLVIAGVGLAVAGRGRARPVGPAEAPGPGPDPVHAPGVDGGAEPSAPVSGDDAGTASDISEGRQTHPAGKGDRGAAGGTTEGEV